MKKVKTAASILFDYTRIPYLQDKRRLGNRPNAVFIMVPKTAGNSVWSLLDIPKLKSMHLAKHRFIGKGPVTFGHVDYAQLVTQGYVSKEFDESAYKFAFVRDPYSRAVSLYYYMKRIKKRKVSSNTTFLSFLRTLQEKGCDPVGLYNVKGLSQCNPQVRWLENTRLDHVGKVETIDKDTQIILQNLGMKSQSVPQLNITSHPDYTRCYCPESKALVEELYKEDFQAYSYDLKAFL